MKAALLPNEVGNNLLHGADEEEVPALCDCQAVCLNFCGGIIAKHPNDKPTESPFGVTPRLHLRMKERSSVYMKS
jgi:hypothetical protein